MLFRVRRERRDTRTRNEMTTVPSSGRYRLVVLQCPHLGSGSAWSRKVMMRWWAQTAATREFSASRMYEERMYSMRGPYSVPTSLQ